MASASSIALIAAIDRALAGDWDGAHAAVQGYEDEPTACWIHAVLHKIEGDAANSRYWYARTQARSYGDYVDPTVELNAIRAALTTGSQ